MVNEAVGIVDGLDGLVGETATAQSYNIEACITDRFTSGDDVGWDIFAEAASSLNHTIAAYATELVHQDVGANDGVVVNNDFSSHFRGVSNDTTATD